MVFFYHRDNDELYYDEGPCSISLKRMQNIFSYSN